MSNDPIDTLFREAEDHNISMAAICERAGVAQSTPSRWRTDRNGATYSTIKKLRGALGDLVEEKRVSRLHNAPDTVADPAPSPDNASEIIGSASQSEAA
ncbi:hypothetical protein BH10PSE12_BH10PSE12_03030 [soil metagenome]